MKVRETYDQWAASYDEIPNKTRDLEAAIVRETFPNAHYGNIVELGCGTGKNTEWLSLKADFVIALDFSAQMIAKAGAKIESDNVSFIQADLNKVWPLKPGWANLITCSLVLEHIETLPFIFDQARNILQRNGRFYICELHPAKQYSGSQAHFQNAGKEHRPEAFVHHISDYLEAAKKANFDLVDLKEYFDNDHKTGTPRLLSLVFQKI